MTRVGGVYVETAGLAAAVETIVGRIARREPSYVCLVNVHMVETARRDATVRHALEHATMRLPDGAPVAWAAARRSRATVPRVAGSDVFDALLRKPGLRHYFYGSTNAVLRRLEERVAAWYPHAVVAGSHSPPFRELTDSELAAHSADIDRTRPDIVWVGLGGPRQELWMARARPLVEAPVLVGVGAVFDFMAGTRARAPRWMQRAGLEWLHRLLQEPRRLAPRYLTTNASFVRHTLFVHRSAAE